MADSGWKRCARCGALITGDLFYLEGTGWLGQCCVEPRGDGAFMMRPEGGQ